MTPKIRLGSSGAVSRFCCDVFHALPSLRFPGLLTLGVALLGFCLAGPIALAQVMRDSAGAAETAEPGAPTEVDFIYVTYYLASQVRSLPLPSGPPVTIASITNPTGIAFGPDGYVYISNDAAPPLAAIDRMLPDGSNLTTFFSGGILGQPHGLAFDKSGNLFVATAGGAKQGGYSVVKFTAPLVAGNPPSVFLDGTNGLRAPIGLAFDATGNLFVANTKGDDGAGGTGSVLAFAPDKTVVLALQSGFDVPYDVAFDRRGNLFVSNAATTSPSTPSIMEFDPATGTLLKTITSSALVEPLGLLFDRTGNLYVADAMTGAIEEFAPNGTESTFAPAELKSAPHFLALFRSR